MRLPKHGFVDVGGVACFDRIVSLGGQVDGWGRATLGEGKGWKEGSNPEGVV